MLSDYAVRIEDGVITHVGLTGEVPVSPGARVIDAAGGFLLPGLIDAHVHLRATEELLAYVAHGITTIVQMSGTTEPLTDLMGIRAQIVAGQRPGPTIYTTGPMVDGEPPNARAVSFIVTDPNDVGSFLEQHERAGYHLVKVHNNVSPAVLAALTAEATRRRLTVVGHMPVAVSLDAAYTSGLRMIAHAQLLYYKQFLTSDCLTQHGFWPCVDRIRPDTTVIPEIVAGLRDAGMVVTPNLSYVRATLQMLDDTTAVFAHPETARLAPAVRTMWSRNNPANGASVDAHRRDLQRQLPFLEQLTRALHDAGVPLLLGTDAALPGLHPGVSAHGELRALVHAGLTPFEALRTATSNAGHFLRTYARTEEDFGVIKEGFRGDLILLRGNPLDDIDNVELIEGVATRGRWAHRRELDSLRTTTVR